MNRHEVRHRLIAALVEAGRVLTLAELARQCGVTQRAARPVLDALVAEDLVVTGKLTGGGRSPQFRWAAAWARELDHRTGGAKEKLRAIVSQSQLPPGRIPVGAQHAVPLRRTTVPEIDSRPVLAFHEYITGEYTPPRDKRFCVFLQCSVRRPFSSSPSHASMRRAISVATGYDPAKDFESCPVHVVVLASRMGPVPYELEDIYPANVSGGGVKHFGPDYYQRVKPILAERMAQYVIAHRASYDHLATFTDGRYGEVMREARKIAMSACGDGAHFPVFPTPDGPRVKRLGRSIPRTYWQKYWIQLYQAIVGWLEPADRRGARARLKAMDVDYA